MDPDQTAPVWAVWSRSTLFVYEASNILVDNKNIHFVVYALRVKIHVSSVCIRLGFSWNARTLAGPNNLLILHQIINRTWFPCLADEITDPRPDMNIKVAGFTLSEKFINTNVYLILDTGSFVFFVSGCDSSLQIFSVMFYFSMSCCGHVEWYFTRA